MTDKQIDAEVMPLSHALAEIGKWGNLIRAFQRVQDVAKVMESAEQTIRSLTEQGVQIRTENDALLADRAKALAEKEAAKHEAKRLKAAAQDKADTLLADARADAATIKAQAEAAQAAAAEAVAASERQLQELEATHAALQAKHDSLQEAIAGATDELAKQAADKVKAAMAAQA